MTGEEKEKSDQKHGGKRKINVIVLSKEKNGFCKDALREIKVIFGSNSLKILHLSLAEKSKKFMGFKTFPSFEEKAVPIIQNKESPTIVILGKDFFDLTISCYIAGSPYIICETIIKELPSDLDQVLEFIQESISRNGGHSAQK